MWAIWKWSRRHPMVWCVQQKRNHHLIVALTGPFANMSDLVLFFYKQRNLWNLTGGPKKA